jgi:prevent-host-death family protein
MRTTIHAAKTNLSRLIEKAQSGEEVVIARGNLPVARLVAVDVVDRRRQFGAMKGRARTDKAFFEPLSADEMEAWES